MRSHFRVMQGLFRKHHLQYIAVALALGLCGISHAQPDRAASISIQLDSPSHKVSPMLYGLMTEEINYSYDGGLYAEMVRNRTFSGRSHSQPAHWFLVERGNSSGRMALDDATGPSDALRNSLLIEATKADADNPVGVYNEGYWGMALRPNTTYRASFYAKTDKDDMGGVSLALVSNDSGKVVASTKSESLSSAWKRYEVTLKTGQLEANANNHLVLTVSHPGQVWLSLVSLFPPTYKNRENGNRPDLMEKMAAMKPNFLRLPGGNYLEGDEIQDRFDWKTTIGPLVDRPTHPSPWRYQSTDGMGLLEFLEWTEDLNMEPVLAVYAGYSLKGAHINAGPFLQPFVQDALDEIEFVSGGTDTLWGAKRAQLGHPKPFPLHYVEIGNEDWFDRSGSYEARFDQFNKAIKAKYPQLQTIATMPLKNTKPDMQDDHYYLRAVESYKMASKYDSVDRNGPKIFVGEWATREGSPTPNLNSALGDAALMTGFERNSDLILMASYAPLFVNVEPGGMQWESDLIGYDAMLSYGSPSYYAQVLFAKYLGDTVPKSTATELPNRFFYSATVSQAQGKVYLKLVNGNSEPRTVSVHLDGAKSLKAEAIVETLGGNNPAETNTIREPQRIVPVKTSLKGVKETFEHTVPAYSIQVIELSTQ
ncbi:alpha-L-arabinofuranosidase C-terminal domain-containing protein [Edaphobacter sp. HDX4]|uniref:alpha-L-arabinofuranosidase C-terminal domain-containing protein n=1 Tax=Edaphobacter sp. HDX4 TaxID=2794064 RepID=UPI002FE67AC6